MRARALSRRLLWLPMLCCSVFASCGPAIDRPTSGAVPGSKIAPTAPGVPPTLTASEALSMRVIPTPSPGLATVAAASPSPRVASPSPSAVVAPPIVRTILPAANANVPSGSITVSAVLVGRGADLTSASLAVDGADAGGQLETRSPREWAIHGSASLSGGTHTARVLVRDASGGSGGFTWQFSVGEQPAAPEPAPAEGLRPAVAYASAVPKP